MQGCLESVLREAHDTSTWQGQRKPHIKHIVVDAASTDGSVELLGSWAATHAEPRSDSYRFAFISEPDRGQSDGFNKGVRLADTEWICWLNSDDELAPGAFHAFFDVLAGHPEADFVYGHVAFIDETSHPVKTSYTLPYAHSLIKNGVWTPPSSGTFFRRRLFLNELLDTNYHYVMDVEWFLRCGASLNAVLSDHIFSRFRISKEGKTSEMIVSGQITDSHHQERERYRQKYIYTQWPNLSLEQARHKLARRQRLYKIYYYWLKARYIPRYLADRLFPQTTARTACTPSSLKTEH
jgi:glycosyltransferase involved in cell wall biosynthesis